MYRRAFSTISATHRAAASSRSLSSTFSRLPAASRASTSSGFVARRSLSSSVARRSHGESDAGLSDKLASELQYEKDSVNAGEDPEFLANFKSTGTWSIEDKLGQDEVALTRKFGNETIKVLFSIADIDNNVANASESAAAETEGAEESTETPAEEDEDPVTLDDQSLPIRCAITISKGKGQGALTIDAVAQDGMFLVDNISLYNDESLALDMTSDADWKRRGLYMGPAFDHLDEALQTEFESFLEERGIDSNLALFIPDLAEHKEQKEYVKWLDGVKKFIEA